MLATTNYPHAMRAEALKLMSPVVFFHNFHGPQEVKLSFFPPVSLACCLVHFFCHVHFVCQRGELHCCFPLEEMFLLPLTDSQLDFACKYQTYTHMNEAHSLWYIHLISTFCRFLLAVYRGLLPPNYCLLWCLQMLFVILYH